MKRKVRIYSDEVIARTEERIPDSIREALKKEKLTPFVIFEIIKEELQKEKGRRNKREKLFDRIKSMSKDECKQSLIEAGILTEDGTQLTKKYRRK